MKPAQARAVRQMQRLGGGALRIYPAEFRQEYGAEMLQSLSEECRLAARRRGWPGLLRAGGRNLADLLLAAPGVQWDVLGQDLRYGWRMLRANPGFAAAAVLTLALGIGGTSAVFGLVHGILLAPLPFPDPDTLVMIWARNPKGIERNSVAPPDFVDYRRSASFGKMAAFYEESVNLTGPAEHVLSAVVTPEFFEVLGVPVTVGSGVRGAREAVLSFGLWQRRFGGSPAVVGQTLRIDDEAYTIRGVAAPEFRFASRAIALWTAMPEEYLHLSRHARFLSVVGRLRAGTGVTQARAEMGALADGLARQYPASNRGWGVTLVPLKEQVVGSFRRPLLILMGAVGFLLLIACVNVANLLLARSARRQGELAIRTALGASSARMGRQILTESLLIAGLGAGAGLVLCWLALAALRALRPASMPRLDEVGVDPWVVGVAAAAALVSGLSAGFVPLVRVWSGDLRQVMQEGSRSRGSGAGDWLRRGLVSGEVALCLVLLVGAGLLIRSFVRLQGIDPGFRAAGAVTYAVDLPAARYKTGAERSAVLERLLDRTRALPGVTAAGMISSLPLTGGEGHNRFGFVIEHTDEAADDHRFYARWISPGYLASMAIPLQRGRAFTEADRAGAAPVVIIDEELARRYFPNENPLGRTLRLSYDKQTARAIVGVAGAVRLVALEQEPAPQIYIPVLQETRLNSIRLVVRGAGAQERAVVAALRSVDSDLPVYDIQPLEEQVAESIEPRRFQMVLMSLLAGVALALAGVGVYGVISYMVGEREQEVSIRMALGARPAAIVSMVVGQGMRQAGAGITAGLIAAVMLSKVMAGLLFGVKPVDRWTFGLVAGVTALVAAAACAIPGWRAARVDPARALRGG